MVDSGQDTGARCPTGTRLEERFSPGLFGKAADSLVPQATTTENGYPMTAPASSPGRGLSASGEGRQRSVSGELLEAVGRHQGSLIHYVRQMLPDRPDQAQDVVQVTFLRFRKALANGSPIIRPASWLYRVAHNLAVDLNRRENRHCELEEDMLQQAAISTHTVSADPEPAVAFERSERHELALRELRGLPAEDKQILLLKLFEGMTLQQISEATDTKLSTVHYRLGRGLRTLNQRLRALGVVR